MFSTLIDLLVWRATHQPERAAYTFLRDGDYAEATLTYGELDRRARSVGAWLQSMDAVGERVLLLHPPGLEYIAAFFGCLYAGAVAVPAYPPRLNSHFLRLQTIAANARAKLALTTAATLPKRDLLPAQTEVLKLTRWLASDTLEGGEGDWHAPASSGDTLALLQYTSGSTGSPRGVMLSHGNLLHNSGLLSFGFEYTPESYCISWLPVYHDMGLIGGVLQPLYGGFPCALMPPMAFLKRPIRWLQAISNYKATLSGGPNFAYDLCVRKTTAEQRMTLDLSSWSLAFNGSEPVRPETLDRFTAAFEPCGFRREAFFSCYGLAESTLIVSGGQTTAPPVVKTFRAKDLENNRVSEFGASEEGVKVIVGCGRPLPGQKVVIVNPETMRPCPPDEVGEIWVSGPSVAVGYWDQPDGPERVFQTHLADTGEGPFLRTGDSGFLKDGELFIAGRLKDLIIIRGLNYYPQDIEWAVENSHTKLQSNCCTAFSIDAGDEERLVIVQEVDPHHRVNLNELIDVIRDAVAEHNELQVYAVLLVKPGSIPRTSSGKLRRQASRAKFLTNGFPQVAKWQEKIAAERGGHIQTPETPLQGPESIESWLVSRFAVALGVGPHEIDPGRPIARYGLDSLKAIELAHDIEVSIGVSLPMVRFLRNPSITEIAVELAAELKIPSPTYGLGGGRADEAITDFALSHGQRALWFLHQLTLESSPYNLAVAVCVSQTIVPDALRRALQALARRHPALRTTFAAIAGEPVQRILNSQKVDFNEEDASTWSQPLLMNRLVEEAHRPFDLEQGPLLRVRLFTQPAGSHALLLVAHHIVTDFWSLSLILEELGIQYLAETQGIEPTLAPLPLRYVDYVHWQAEMLRGPEGARLWSYWERQLAGELPSLSFLTDRPRPIVQTYRGASYPFRLSEKLSTKLRIFSQTQDTTLYTTLLAVFQALLSVYTCQEDILVGSPVTGRRSSRLARVVGYFVNPIVIRSTISAKLGFIDLLSQVRQTVLAALEHQDFPFPLLVERLQPVRDPGRSSIFQVMFVFQQSHQRHERDLAAFSLGEAGARVKIGELRLQSMALERRAAQFDLSLVVAEVGGALGASLQYNTDIFDHQTIIRLAGHLTTLLESVISDPKRRVSDLPLLTSAERDQAILAWNCTKTDYPVGQRIHQAFEAQARRSPHAVAVVFENDEITYQELNQRANRLAHHLIALGVAPGASVGICIERSLDMVVGLIGILKAGAAYVPLDPAYPRERTAFLLEDAQITVVITQKRLVDLLPDDRRKAICLDADWQSIARQDVEDPITGVTSENPAYVIYTSGSTGKPKGVMISHRSVINFFAGMDHRIGCGAEDVLLAITGVSFDISVLELFWTLARGIKVILLAEWAPNGAPLQPRRPPSEKNMQFSLFYFANNDSANIENKYRLVLEGARFADHHGFTAVWTPERHFHEFGGLYPNPSVISAAIAVVTERVQIRAGSVVLPLHPAIRVAEEWALVDNLSNGRVAIAFASGWHADDFVLFPENYAERSEVMFNSIETVKRLWRGGSITTRGVTGNEVEVKVFPKPIQPELPVWITAAGNAETFIKAGAIGANVLTHLLGQNLDEVSEKIKLYRNARAQHGHGSGTGHVTMMLHTFIGEDIGVVREVVRKPFTDYLKSSVSLITNLIRSLDLPLTIDSMGEKDLNDLLDFAFNRYFSTSALFGTPDSCLAMIERLKAIGVDEVACLIDFGVESDIALASLLNLCVLREKSDTQRKTEDYSLSAQARRHRPSIMQCTPSLMRMITMQPDALESLRSVRVLLLGGEVLPAPLAKQVKESLPTKVINMYGPTETAIWSAIQEVGEIKGTVPIGRPISNTQTYILNRAFQIMPPRVAGELYIGGAGLAHGYFHRPDLTAEKFVPNHFNGAPGTRLYRTGDLAYYRPDGSIEFLGRIDNQVKVRGFRVELEEIEAVLSQHQAVRDAVVVSREDSAGDKQLVAYVVPGQGPAPSVAELQTFLKGHLPGFMKPGAFVMLDALPLTSNGKVNRKALPAPGATRPRLGAQFVPPHSGLESIISKVWQCVLKLENIGVHDNFFDLGGHSLLMVQAHSQLQKALNKDIPLIRLLECPTIRSLAERLSREEYGPDSLNQNLDRADKQRRGLMRQQRALMRARGQDD